MSDRGKIIGGIGLFLALAAFPVWYGQGKSAPPPRLPLDTPAIRKMAVKQCIEPASYMRARHMELIDSWRSAAVRAGERVYVASDGKRYPVSLSATCLGCHSNKEKFCDACHKYAGANPSCFQCHPVPSPANAESNSPLFKGGRGGFLEPLSNLHGAVGNPPFPPFSKGGNSSGSLLERNPDTLNKFSREVPG